MKGFERYDLQGWVDNGLSFHPETPVPAPNQTRYIRGYMTRMVVPLVAMSAMGGVAAAASTVDAVSKWQRQLVIAAQSPCVVYDSRSGPDPSSGAVDEFEANANALLAEIRLGALSNVPAQTLTLATKAVGRYADTDLKGRPDWVDKVASVVAKLED
jgi:hypothetical protein